MIFIKSILSKTNFSDSFCSLKDKTVCFVLSVITSLIFYANYFSRLNETCHEASIEVQIKNTIIFGPNFSNSNQQE